MNKILEIKNISKKYNTIDGEIHAIDNISFDINEGEFVVIVGNSGCGKSTLLSILAGLLDKTDGEINYFIEKPIIGYMLQEDALFDHMTIWENVLLGLKILKKVSQENINNVKYLLEKYDLSRFKDKYPRELSGGMKQRVALIRTLAINPDIIFLDEPFSALDFTTRLGVSSDVYQIIKENKKTAIMVTHSIDEAVGLADKVIVLSKSPATIKSIYEINFDSNLSVLDKRNDIKFNEYCNLIRKDLDVIV